MSSLNIASYYGKTGVIKYLVSKNTKNKADKTPYDIVCGYEKADDSQRSIIKGLLK